LVQNSRINRRPGYLSLDDKFKSGTGATAHPRDSVLHASILVLGPATWRPRCAVWVPFAKRVCGGLARL